MAIKSVILSDLSATELTNATHVTAVIRHPDVGFPVQIDMSTDEAGKLQETPLRLIEFELHVPNEPVRTVRVETKVLDKIFGGVNWDDVVAGAQKASSPRSTGSAPRKRAGTPSGSGEKINYTSPENAGKLHRGRITDAEKEWVKANRDKASYNREQQTGKPIDWDDPAEIKRYAL
jgi:hypothetical protein